MSFLIQYLKEKQTHLAISAGSMEVNQGRILLNLLLPLVLKDQVKYFVYFWFLLPLTLGLTKELASTTVHPPTLGCVLQTLWGNGLLCGLLSENYTSPVSLH